MSASPRLTGLPGFVLVWAGQLISLLATSMTQFALTIWVFEKTHSATALGLMQVFYITPFLLISPVAGVLVDRSDRKLMMMISDLSAGLGTLALLSLQALGWLEIWHLYAFAILAGLGNAFQWPAYSAAITTLVPKEHYGRANGLMGLLEAGPAVFAPLLAGALLPVIGLTGIMSLDAATFLLAIAALLVVHVPPPPRTAAGQQARRGGLLSEAGYGFRYIFQRPSLLGLQLVFFAGNLAGGIIFTLLAPMVLTRTGDSESALGIVQSAGAIGGLAGGLIMSVWGGTKRRVHGVLLGHILTGLFGNLLLGLGRDVPGWAVPLFIGALFIPWINGSNQAIWQAKVAPDVQGRVFTARRLIAWITNPLSPIIGGTLADYVLEPAMRSSSGLANAFGWLVGTGPGAGMALLITACAFITVAAGVAGYLTPAVRLAEDRLPDHDLAPAAAAPAAAD